MDRLSRSSGKALTFHGQDIDKSRPMVYKLLTPKMEAANGPTTRTRPDYRSNLQAKTCTCPDHAEGVHLQALPRRLDCPPARRSSGWYGHRNQKPDLDREESLQARLACVQPRTSDGKAPSARP